MKPSYLRALQATFSFLRNRFGKSKIGDFVKGEIPQKSSFLRKPESCYFNRFWTPAFAGVTLQEIVYEITKIQAMADGF
jgi:hypothetical protein